ncbi:MAG: peptidylprolyl isomerase [Deltaproteobacteria bacterium CG11_big_fil_rev_8_21_14_0_20_49_13]|nr:MAG: peptidylprolyl isomerase [Deltaproteobacteria bacterium CG11_big_fil_rev_8_21_14_0_20_49_13]
MDIANGKTVSINYTLTVDGKVADSSEGREPLVYVAGSGQIIPGLDGELVGLKKGDKKHVSVAPGNGYGVRDPKAVQKVPRTALEGQPDIKPGSVLQGSVGEQEFQAVITKVGKDDVEIDLNHPLAGKTLEFDVEVVDVQ